MKISTRLVPLLIVIGVTSVAMTGCEIIADFDRTLIDAGQALPTDGSTDALASDGAVKDGSGDVATDSTLPDASTDAADTSVADTSVADTSVADTSVADTSIADTSVPDAGQDAADAASE